jgi:titin
MVHDEETRRVCLTISEAQATDRGVYTARATNPLGDAKCFAHLIVRSHNMETPDMARRGWAPVAPSFTELLHDTCVLSGDSARFECIVAGKPTPKVRFSTSLG